MPKKLAAPVIFLAACVVITAAGPSTAQDQPGGNKADAPRRTRGEIRATRQLHRQVRETLDLDEKQAKVIDELFEDHLVELKKIIREMEESQEANAQRGRKIREELKEAKQAGDEERLRALRDELRQMHSARSRLRQVGPQFNERVIAELNEQQAKRYRKMAFHLRRWATLRAGGKDGLRSINSAFRQLDMSEEQLEKVRAITKELGSTFAQTLNDPKGRSAVTAEYREKVMAVLDSAQRRRFLELEEEQQAADQPPHFGAWRPGNLRSPGRKNPGDQEK
ncbi:MAG: hypothetical protein V3W34_14910 [Phycisphaerae bacterium]